MCNSGFRQAAHAAEWKMESCTETGKWKAENGWILDQFFVQHFHNMGGDCGRIPEIKG